MNDSLGLRKRLQLLEARLRGNVRKDRHPLQQLFWECTLRCNLHCRHCGSDCKVSADQPDMPLADFLPVLDDVAAHYDPHGILIITTGGEPLVRPDIEDVGRAITSRGFAWGMVTNGMLLDADRLDRLVAAGLRTVAVSLDGFEDDHNWMRGHAESHRRAVRAIRALAERAPLDAPRPALNWDVITCVNRRNIDSLERLRDFLISLGVRQWRLFTVFPAGRAKDDPALQLTPDELHRLMRFIQRERRALAEAAAAPSAATEASPRPVIDVSFSCEGYLGPYELEVRDHAYFCQAGIHVASILNDGSISGCLSIRSDYHQGNIYRSGTRFSDVWEAGFAPYRRRGWMRTGECRHCKAWTFCEGNGMHLRDGDGRLVACNYRQLFG